MSALQDEENRSKALAKALDAVQVPLWSIFRATKTGGTRDLLADVLRGAADAVTASGYFVCALCNEVDEEPHDMPWGDTCESCYAKRAGT